MKYCDENELLPLLIAQGLVRRVCTIELEVRPMGGDKFRVRLDAAKPSVGEAKAEITRVEGTRETQQELYKFAMRTSGEGGVEAELLEDNDRVLENGEVVAMALKEFDPLRATVVSDSNALAIHIWLACHVDREAGKTNVLCRMHSKSSTKSVDH
jgi:hypothetical protein